MPAHICTGCGVQYPNAESPPSQCVICRDDRRLGVGAKQTWTTQAEMRGTHFNAFRRHEPGLMGIGTLPSFAMGQRALLLRTAQGNILWDCLSFLDDATIALIGALGGISAIAASHPHYYGAMIEWSHAFNSAPVYLHAADRKFITRLDSSITFWEDDAFQVIPGVTLLRVGGHFAGSSVMHWAQGAGGRGALLASDTLRIGPDGMISFMRSYPNLIPLDASTAYRIADTLLARPFDSIYGSFWDQVVAADGQSLLSRSVQRYVHAVTNPPD